jgi:hypothetical protein
MSASKGDRNGNKIGWRATKRAMANGESNN